AAEASLPTRRWPQPPWNDGAILGRCRQPDTGARQIAEGQPNLFFEWHALHRLADMVQEAGLDDTNRPERRHIGDLRAGGEADVLDAEAMVGVLPARGARECLQRMGEA